MEAVGSCRSLRLAENSKHPSGPVRLYKSDQIVLADTPRPHGQLCCCFCQQGAEHLCALEDFSTSVLQRRGTAAEAGAFVELFGVNKT